MSPHNILLYPQICPSLSRHQRSLLLQSTGTHTETHIWTLCRERQTLEHSDLKGISSSIPPPHNLGRYTEEKTKDCKIWGGGHDSKKQGLPDMVGLSTDELTETAAAPAGSVLVQTRGGGHRRLSLAKKLPAIDTCFQRKNKFSPMKSHCILWPLYNPVVDVNTKWTQGWFCSHFVSSCSVWAFFVLLALCLYIMIHSTVYLWILLMDVCVCICVSLVFWFLVCMFVI